MQAPVEQRSQSASECCALHQPSCCFHQHRTEDLWR
ncbi:hypothetical protein HED51_09315 [Ochrobactrum grignonense]|nr:hypothetical protein [Brucella grignonensis]